MCFIFFINYQNNFALILIKLVLCLTYKIKIVIDYIVKLAFIVCLYSFIDLKRIVNKSYKLF